MDIYGSDFAGSEADEVLEYHIDKDQWSVSSLRFPFCETDCCVKKVALIHDSFVIE